MSFEDCLLFFFTLPCLLAFPLAISKVPCIFCIQLSTWYMFCLPVELSLSWYTCICICHPSHYVTRHFVNPCHFSLYSAVFLADVATFTEHSSCMLIPDHIFSHYSIHPHLVHPLSRFFPFHCHLCLLFARHCWPSHGPLYHTFQLHEHLSIKSYNTSLHSFQLHFHYRYNMTQQSKVVHGLEVFTRYTGLEIVFFVVAKVCYQVQDQVAKLILW